jgi:glutathione S-transferase
VPTLYRCNTPTNWLCPCGSVARALERHEIEFDEIRLPQMRSKRPEVEALTDQQRVPVLVIDGQAIFDSRRILQYLEYRRTLPGTEARAEQPARPEPAQPDRERAPLWE